MKTCKWFHCILALGSFILAANPALSQSPALTCQLFAGVTLTGATGSVYSIQASSNLASNSWHSVGLVRCTVTNVFWTDTNQSAASGLQFYRAVLTSTNLVWVQPGTFTMGSPTNEALRGTDEVQHVVTLTSGFYIGKFPLMQSEYQAVIGSNPSYFQGNLSLPVESVTWFDATNYCYLRTAQERAAGLIPTNWVYRLPTESEWEYACRAGTVTAFYLGNALRSGQANFIGTNEYDSVVGSEYNPSGINLNTTTPVGTYPIPNGWGLYDLAGNVLEWCQDVYAAYPTGSVVDPTGPAVGAGRTLRGGSFVSFGSSCRSAARSKPIPGNSKKFIGFRVVLSQQ